MMFADLRRVVAMLLLLGAWASRSQAAQGLNLAWGTCFGEGPAVQNVVFACDTNAGKDRLTGSFVLAATIPTASGVESTVEVFSASNSLPAWWQFRNPGSCRRLSLIANGSVDPDWQHCVDWAVSGAGVLPLYCTAESPCGVGPIAANQGRVLVVGAVTQEEAVDLPPAQEFFAFNLVIDHANTAGSAACGGCSIPACILLSSIAVESTTLARYVIDTPTVQGSNVVTWQGGSIPVTRATAGCPAATPLRNSTWGSLKSLYR